ncbi:MAG: phytoene desaturase [Saprospiraceae bacterium]|nr:phytoene desaturase [Saprospiraceae bacterium]
MASKKSVAIIGAGISGMAAAIELADKAYKPIVYEKNNSFGGRGRQIEKDGFLFDLGPSWYWMPDIFEKFFNDYGKSSRDYFELLRLDPSFRIFHKEGILDVPAGVEACIEVFEHREKGSGIFLRKFLKEAQYKYETGMRDFVRKPSLKWSEYFDWDLLKAALRLQMFQSLESVVYKNIKDELLRQWLCFPVLFLGAKPSQTPALYSLMNYAEMELGTWYPKGGMIKLFEALYALALEKGVKFEFMADVQKIDCDSHHVKSILVNNREVFVDAVVATADYHHVDEHLLAHEHRQYSKKYWESRVMAPSAMLYYLGVGETIDGLLHHNLFFDTDFERHAGSIYDHPEWPEDPLFYVCVPSKTDSLVAPKGKENLFILVPLAAGIQDQPEERQKLFEKVIRRLEKKTGTSIVDKILFKMEMGPSDFVELYNSYKGNAYGLANTLMQTAVLKPRLKHHKLTNLFFAGQLTHPGPGLPPSLISGQLSATLLQKLKL